MRNLLNLIIGGVSDFNDNFSLRTKSRITTGIFTLFFLAFFAGYEINPSIRFSLLVALGILFTGIMVFVNINRPREDFKWNKKLMIPLVVIGILFLGNGIYFHMVGYIAIAIVFAFVLPFYYYTTENFNQRDFFSLAFAKGVFYSFLVLLVLGFTSGPQIDIDQYSSILHNPNGLANFLIVAIPAIFYLGVKCETKKGSVAYYIFFGIALVEMFLSRSRTGYISILFVLLLILVGLLVNVGVKETFKKVLVLTLIIALALPSFFFLMTTVKKAEAKVLPQIQLKGYSPSGKNGDLSLEDAINGGFDRSLKGLNGEGSNFTSGRTEIWKEYGKKISLKGHKKEELKVEISYRTYASTNAHNVYLQVAYSTGIITGVLLLLFVGALCVYSLRYFGHMIKIRRFSWEWILTSTLFLGFFFSTITTTGYVPYTYPIALGFWYTIGQYFIKGDRFYENPSHS